MDRTVSVVLFGLGLVMVAATTFSAEEFCLMEIPWLQVFGVTTMLALISGVCFGAAIEFWKGTR